ncbi:IclR family transcriptional regulator [Bauldia litoralis]|uniref:IclR family transcriptional regulator n=1 Tax=Bauldia litoralis TaxID=665467 RepID=UPI003266CF32
MTTPEITSRHRIPVIDRMMEVLSILEKRTGGASIRDIVDRLGLPRTTVYRILNTLQLHNIVRRNADGIYRLGPRLLALASQTLADAQDYDLAALSVPHLERIAARTGEGSKISVLDDDGVLVVAAMQGTREYALTVAPGQRQPLHAGAASKLLVAHLPKEELTRRVGDNLFRYTERTLVDRKRLLGEFARIRRRGWAEDRGEYAPNVGAYAAPIRDRAGKVIAALSVPFLQGGPAAHGEAIRAAVIAGARGIANDLPAPPAVPNETDKPLAAQSKKAASSSRR